MKWSFQMRDLGGAEFPVKGTMIPFFKYKSRFLKIVCGFGEKGVGSVI
jgi:hypothetical protein